MEKISLIHPIFHKRIPIASEAFIDWVLNELPHIMRGTYKACSQYSSSINPLLFEKYSSMDSDKAIIKDVFENHMDIIFDFMEMYSRYPNNRDYKTRPVPNTNASYVVEASKIPIAGAEYSSLQRRGISFDKLTTILLCGKYTHTPVCWGTLTLTEKGKSTLVIEDGKTWKLQEYIYHGLKEERIRYRIVVSGFQEYLSGSNRLRSLIHS